MNPIKTILYKIVWINQRTEEQGDVMLKLECKDNAEAIMEVMQERQLHREFEVVPIEDDEVKTD